MSKLIDIALIFICIGFAAIGLSLVAAFQVAAPLFMYVLSVIGIIFLIVGTVVFLIEWIIIKLRR